MRSIVLLVVLAACTGTDRVDQAAPPPTPAPSATAGASTVTAAAVDSAAVQRASMLVDSAAAPPDSAPVAFDAAGHPIVPIVLRDYCEGEDCTSHYEAIACLPTGLRGAPSSSAPVVSPLAAGSKVQVLRRDLHVPSVGVVVVKKSFVLDHEMVEAAAGDVASPRSDTVRFARGDTVYVISYLALGRWRWALHGKLYDSDQFWASTEAQGLGAADPDSSRAVARSAPTTEDWWYVQPGSGAPGWWRGDDRVELQSIGSMEKWNDDCAQVAKRAAQPKRP
jgi:hypothetical protein